MTVKEDELKIIKNFLSQIDIPEDEKTEILNKYLVTDTANRILVLQMMYDYINQTKNKGKSNGR